MAIKPVANLTIDNPDADGRIEKHGFAQQWDFKRRRESEAPRASWQDDEWVLDWDLDGCEVIASQNLLALKGNAVKADQPKSGWTFSGSQGTPADYWREETILGRPTVKWLAYIDARADQWGAAISAGAVEPRICVWLRRAAPPPDQTASVWYQIALFGDPVQGAGQVGYALQVPIHDETYKYPVLLRNIGGGAEDWDWEVIHEWRTSVRAKTEDDGAVYQRIWIQQIDGLLLIYFDDAERPLEYDPRKDAQGQDTLLAQRGLVGVRFDGHAGAFNFDQIDYAASGTAEPRGWLKLPPWMNPAPNVPNYKIIESARSVGNTSWERISPDPPTDPPQYRPKLTLTRAGGEDGLGTPIVYAVSDWLVPKFAAARSEPVETEGRKELIELSWTRRWPRDWWFRAVLRDPEHYWLDKLTAQRKVAVEVGWDTAADTQIMVGYIKDPAKDIEAGEIEEQLVITGRDYIMARLAEKKFAAWFCPPEGWQMREWVEEALKRAGVPVALIEIASETTPYEVPVLRRGESAFRIGRDTPLVRMLDDVLKTHKNATTGDAEPWFLGVSAAGKITVGPEPTYSTPDYVLDDTTQSKDDWIEWLQVTTDDDFRNYVAVFADDDPARLEGGVAMDEPSHKTPADDKFVGEDLWHVRVEPGAPDDEMKAGELLTHYLRETRRIEWRTNIKPTLGPDSFVQVDITDSKVPAGSMFRIPEDHGYINPDRGEARHTLIGVLEQ